MKAYRNYYRTKSFYQVAYFYRFKDVDRGVAASELDFLYSGKKARLRY
jgi:hypothetical protein